MNNQNIVDGSIVIIGTGEVKAMPDKLIIYYCVESNDANAQTVSSKIDDVVLKFFAELKKMELDQEATAEGIVIEPVFSTKERKGPRRLIGYQGSLQVKVTLHDFALISRVNEMALDCGMTKISEHEYKVSDRRKYEDEATHLAAESVKHQAEFLAGEFGLDISKPSQLRLYNEQDVSPYMRPRAAMCMASKVSMDMENAEEDTSVYKPEPIVIRARIEATYSYQH